MRNDWKCILSLAVTAVMAVSVQAAEGLVPELGTVELLLLRQESVQKELKIGSNEATMIRDFTEEQHKKAMSAEKLSKAEQDQKFEQLSKENEAFVKKNLKPEQQDRLIQIAIQRAGLLWVTSPHVAAKLNLTEKQKEQAKIEQKKARTETDEALTANGSAERNKKLKELRDKTRERLTTLLTPEQQEKWKEMIGAPFHGEFVFESDVTAK